MATSHTSALGWRHLEDGSILLFSTIHDSGALCSANGTASSITQPGVVPGQAVLPFETAKLMMVHSWETSCRLQLYTEGPRLMYRLLPIQPERPYAPGYLEEAAARVRCLMERTWIEKMTGQTFNQLPIHPRHQKVSGQRVEASSDSESQSGTTTEKGEGTRSE